jgi:hypothetical protein
MWKVSAINEPVYFYLKNPRAPRALVRENLRALQYHGKFKTFGIAIATGHRASTPLHTALDDG